MSTRNGTVRIFRYYGSGRGTRRGGTAHVHRYATIIIVHELSDDKGRDSASRLTIEATGNDPHITLEFTDGPKLDLKIIFKPVEGDPIGWEEMVAFAEGFAAVWNAGYRVTPNY